jgi:hypothetical protein
MVATQSVDLSVRPDESLIPVDALCLVTTMPGNKYLSCQFSTQAKEKARKSYELADAHQG